MLSISPIETAFAEVRAFDVLDEADVGCRRRRGVARTAQLGLRIQIASPS
jgi:hypothetical protein